MARFCAQPIKCEYIWRLANQELVILPSFEKKSRKNALCLNQSAFSDFALYVIRTENNRLVAVKHPFVCFQISTQIITIYYKATCQKSRHPQRKEGFVGYVSMLLVSPYFWNWIWRKKVNLQTKTRPKLSCAKILIFGRWLLIFGIFLGPLIVLFCCVFFGKMFNKLIVVNKICCIS